MKSFLPYVFGVVFLLVMFSCGNSSRKKALIPSSNLKGEAPKQAAPKPHDKNSISWRNPALLPIGADLGRFLRSYYLVGDHQKMSSFLIAPEGYSKEQTLQYLQALKWGYEIRLTNVQWTDETNFTLIYKTNQQQTTGREMYKGALVNDTAKLYICPENTTLFQRCAKEGG